MSLIEKAAWLIASDKIDGDYLEFGVFQGGAFIEAYCTLKRVFNQRINDIAPNSTATDASERQAIWDRMRFFAFDSFEGLPELQGIDKNTRDFAKGQYAAAMDQFLTNVDGGGVSAERVVCVPGWFDQTCVPSTVDKYKMRKAAVVWIDCDLYHSTKTVLAFLTPLLQDGTILIFDDWYSFRGNPDLGEQRAMTEWSKTVSDFTFAEYHKEGPWRTSFITSFAKRSNPQ